MNRKIQTLLALLVVASVLLAACAPEAEPTSAPAESTGNGETPTIAPEDPAGQFSPLNVTGDIITAGSSTVFPLSERMSERFRDEGFSGNITVDSIGSGAGLERFCVAGKTDIANASRAIHEDEIASCESIGRTPIEFRVGTDALAIVVSNENDFLTDITMEQLALIFSTAVDWSDVDPSWPNEPIQRYSPGTDSGTYDYFVEEVLGDDATLLQNSVNTQYSEDDNVLVQGVLGSPYAIGYFGYAYYQENAGTLKILNIDGVEPTETTAEDGSYPLARPLFIYSDATIMNEKPQVAAFIHFYLSFVNEEILDVGYFPASQAAFDTNWENFYNALGMANPM
ncbi:MAG: phosphate ABC transporter substrate-binding protein PstS family protein [Chloroflexi bacterium]|nr:phosphate ABC transporter substrate-binding protein PstS family protein [Chloroflexota bacterium]